MYYTNTLLMGSFGCWTKKKHTSNDYGGHNGDKSYRL